MKGLTAHGGLVALAALATALLCSGCFDFGFVCENKIKQQVPSPGGTFKAVVFDRECGATTGFSTQVSILAAASDLPDDGGNALILDGTIDLRLRWNSSLALSIAGSRTSPQVFHQKTRVNGVRISYPD